MLEKGRSQDWFLSGLSFILPMQVCTLQGNNGVAAVTEFLAVHTVTIKTHHMLLMGHSNFFFVTTVFSPEIMSGMFNVCVHTYIIICICITNCLWLQFWALAWFVLNIDFQQSVNACMCFPTNVLN